MFDIKSQLEAALKAHLDSLPEGGDIPPPAVDPTNVTGVNDPDKPELHIATPNGPQKASAPLAAQQFQGLHPDAKAKVADTGNAPRGYRSPVATNAALASTIKVANAPKVSQGEDDGELLSPPGPEQMPEMDLTSPPPVAAQKAAPPPGQASSPGSGGPLASSDMQAAQDASRRGRMIAGIGEVADSMAHQPMNLADYAISRGGGHPIETGPDTHAWDRIRADSDRPLAQLAQKLQLQRQATEDALTHRVKEADIGEKNATAYKAMHPEPKPPHEPLFDPAGFKSSLKELYPGKAAQIDKLADTKDALEAAKTDYENVEQNKRGIGKGITLLNVGADVGLGKEQQGKQIEEGSKISTAREQVANVLNDYKKISPLEVGASKFGLNSANVTGFNAGMLALIDKVAQVETGATGRQSQVEQWKKVFEGGSMVSNEQMEAATGALQKALDAADHANAGRTKGLAHVGASQGPVKMKFPSGAVHDVPAADVEKAKQQKGAVEVGG